MRDGSTLSSASSPDPGIVANSVRTHCPYCAFQCGIVVSTIAQTLTIAGDADFPVNAGALCVKGWTAAETLDHPERLLTPLVRNTAGHLIPATWDEAIEKFVSAAREIEKKHGCNAMAVFGGG